MWCVFSHHHDQPGRQVYKATSDALLIFMYIFEDLYYLLKYLLTFLQTRLVVRLYFFFFLFLNPNCVYYCDF